MGTEEASELSELQLSEWLNTNFGSDLSTVDSPRSDHREPSLLSITADRHQWAAPDVQTINQLVGEVKSFTLLDEHSPAPKVVHRSNTRATGKYPCFRKGTTLQWKSTGELHAMRLLDCDPLVTGFRSRPCEIQFVLDGAAQCHWPDLSVEVDGALELWDVIPTSKALKLAPRTALLFTTLPKLGFLYRAVPAPELAKLPRITNAQTLLRFGRPERSNCEREAIRRGLAQSGLITWKDAANGVYGINGRETICRMVLEGSIMFDHSRPLTSSTDFTQTKRSS